MGTRITRAAPHLPQEAVQQRMQGERRPWCRRRWEIIYQALTAPKPRRGHRKDGRRVADDRPPRGFHV